MLRRILHRCIVLWLASAYLLLPITQSAAYSQPVKSGDQSRLVLARAYVKDRLDRLIALTPQQWEAISRRHPEINLPLEQARENTNKWLSLLNGMTSDQARSWVQTHQLPNLNMVMRYSPEQWEKSQISLQAARGGDQLQIAYVKARERYDLLQTATPAQWTAFLQKRYPQSNITLDQARANAYKWLEMLSGMTPESWNDFTQRYKPLPTVDAIMAMTPDAWKSRNPQSTTAPAPVTPAPSKAISTPQTSPTGLPQPARQPTAAAPATTPANHPQPEKAPSKKASDQ